MISACRFLIVASLLATAVSTLGTCPHQLAYFNELAGGPANGYKHLLHSSLDWGQDLLLVKEWYVSNGSNAPLYFLHSKYGRPADFGLPVTSPQTNYRGNGRSRGLLAGFHIVGMNCLCGDDAYFVDENDHRQLVSPQEVEPYRQMRPVFRAGYSVSVFFVDANAGSR